MLQGFTAGIKQPTCCGTLNGSSGTHSSSVRPFSCKLPVACIQALCCILQLLVALPYVSMALRVIWRSFWDACPAAMV